MKTLTAALTLLMCAQASAQAPPEFDVWEYRVLGNTLLPPVDIERVVYPHLGAGKTFDSVQQVRAALEVLYRDKGYGTVFVDIPEQDVLNGIVRLRVTEGQLDRVRVTGARYFSNGRIREALPALERGAVPNLTEFQEQLANVNRQARDRQVTPVLRAGRTPGTVDMELKVQDELPLHAGIEANDRHTADTSRTRVSVDLRYDNLFDRQHSLAFQYQTAPEEPAQSRVLAATYVLPASDRGDLLALYAVDTKSDVATVGDLSVLGAGRIYGARYIVPLPEATGRFHSMTLGVDFKDFLEDIRFATDNNLATPIKYLSWSLSYGGGLRTAHTSTTYDVGLNFGIRGLVNDSLDFENKHFKAKPNYEYLRASVEHERSLVAGFRLFGRVGGQFTTEPLIPNEQISIGGADSVRGYLESEALGDYGFHSTLELRSPPFGLKASRAYLLGFYDAGVVTIVDALPGQATRIDLSSWGVGLRFEGFGGLRGALDWAEPLVATDRIAAGKSRVHFQMRYDF